MPFVEIPWSFTRWEWVFGLFCVYRYLRLIINTFAHWMYKSIPKPENPTLSNHDVTVIVPTIENNVEELREPILSVLACEPSELILVTTVDRHPKLLDFARSLKDPRVKVLYSRIANKRLQLHEAIPKVQTAITILVDDDVTWPKTILPWLLAAFERPKIGAVGPCQRVKRLTSGSLLARCWNWLGADYIERRNFEISATHWVDGGTSCMSGRTCAFRSEILKHSLFLNGFCTERWGQYHLNADDDNFVTRWLVSHDWSTWIQYNDECMITTTLENNPNFLRQCLRWARSNWRSNWTSLFRERYVYRQQPYSLYTIYFATFTSLGLATDPFLFYAFYQASKTWSPSSRPWGWAIVVFWYLATKIVKRISLYNRDPWDILFLPVSIVFGFMHGFIKIYALWTWNEVRPVIFVSPYNTGVFMNLICWQTSWGSRPDGDIDNSERMTARVLLAEVMTNPSANSKGLIRYADQKHCTSEKEEFHDSGVEDT